MGCFVALLGTGTSFVPLDVSVRHGAKEALLRLRPSDAELAKAMVMQETRPAAPKFAKEKPAKPARKRSAIEVANLRAEARRLLRDEPKVYDRYGGKQKLAERLGITSMYLANLLR